MNNILFPVSIKLRLISFFLVSFSQLIFSPVSAQQRLLSMKKYDYNGFSTAGGDSSVFIYGNNPGTLSSNEPVFEFDGTFFNWFYIKPLIKCDTEYRFGGSSYTPFDTINYQFTAGLVTSNQSTLNPTKNLYAYNTNNNLVSSEKQVLYSFSPNWQTESKEEYEYYSNGLKSVTRKYFSDQILLIYVDSMFYNENNKLIKFKSTDFNISTGQPTSIFQSIISYNGNEVSNVKTFFGSSFTFFNLQLNWDIDYNYVAGKVNQITATDIGGATVLIDYTYDNLNQKIRSVIGYKNGALDRKEEYEYDNNGFITKEKLQTSSSPGILYVTDENKFYYEQSPSTASLDEVKNVLLNIFPNPTYNFITITTDENLIGHEFTIYNSLGQYIRNGSIKSTSTICNFEDVSNGIYFLHLNNEVYKVVKK